MAGSKRNRIKKAFSPSSSINATPSPHKELPVDPDVEDSDGLLDDLMAQLDSTQHTDEKEAVTVLRQIENTASVQDESQQRKSARSRFEARQARKVAEKADTYSSQTDAEAEAKLREETKTEEEAIKRICDEHNLVMHEINPDGHCLFSAIADQLYVLNMLPAEKANYLSTRIAASQYIYTHADDFLPFLPSIDGEDGLGSTSAGLMNDVQLQQYCLRIRDTGAWGGEPEILALSKAFNVPIHVAQTGNPPVVVHNPSDSNASEDNNQPTVWISYHRRMYGLGEHYNSLRPKVS